MFLPLYRAHSCFLTHRSQPTFTLLSGQQQLPILKTTAVGSMSDMNDIPVALNTGDRGSRKIFEGVPVWEVCVVFVCSTSVLFSTSWLFLSPLFLDLYATYARYPLCCCLIQVLYVKLITTAIVTFSNIAWRVCRYLRRLALATRLEQQASRYEMTGSVIIIAQTIYYQLYVSCLTCSVFHLRAMVPFLVRRFIQILLGRGAVIRTTDSTSVFRVVEIISSELFLSVLWINFVRPAFRTEVIDIHFQIGVLAYNLLQQAPSESLGHWGDWHCWIMRQLAAGFLINSVSKTIEGILDVLADSSFNLRHLSKESSRLGRESECLARGLGLGTVTGGQIVYLDQVLLAADFVSAIRGRNKSYFVVLDGVCLKVDVYGYKAHAEKVVYNICRHPSCVKMGFAELLGHALAGAPTIVSGPPVMVSSFREYEITPGTDLSDFCKCLLASGIPEKRAKQITASATVGSMRDHIKPACYLVEVREDIVRHGRAILVDEYGNEFTTDGTGKVVVSRKGLNCTAAWLRWFGVPPQMLGLGPQGPSQITREEIETVVGLKNFLLIADLVAGDRNNGRNGCYRRGTGFVNLDEPMSAENIARFLGSVHYSNGRVGFRHSSHDQITYVGSPSGSLYDCTSNWFKAMDFSNGFELTQIKVAGCHDEPGTDDAAGEREDECSHSRPS